MLHIGMRAEECKKITREMITTDEDGDPIILLKGIAKGRTNNNKDITYISQHQ